MNKVLSYLLKEYDHNDTEIFLKAKIILVTTLSVILTLFGIILYTSYLVSLANSVIIIEIIGLTIMLFALVFLVRGKYNTAIHIILISGFVTAWSVIFVDPSDSMLMKMDTIVFVIGLLAVLPLFFFRNRKPMVLYFIINLFLFFLFNYHLHKTTNLSTKEMVDYFFDNLVVMMFVSFISFSLFSINKRVRNSLKKELEERKHSEDINKTLFAISNAVNTTMDLSDLYKQIHGFLGEIIDVTNFYIAIFDTKENSLHFPYYRDTEDDDYSSIKNFNPVGSLTGLVVSKRKPIFLTKDELKELSTKNAVWGTISMIWMGVPLMVKDEVLGVIAVQSYTDPYLYNKHDLDVLVAISDQVAIAIDRKRKEDELRKSEQKFRTAFKTSPHIITLINIDDWAYVEINDAFTKVLKYTPKEVIGKSSIELDIWKDLKDKERLVLELKKRGFVENFRADFKDKDGKIINGTMSARTVEMGANKYLLVVTQDLTEFKKNEQKRLDLEIRLQQAQKMEAIGTLAGGIAHDFNNILSGIFGYSQLALNMIGNPDKVKECIAQIDKGSKRAAGLVRQILTFSRQEEYQKHPLQISVSIKEAIQLLRSSIPRSIEIKEKLNSKSTVLADPTKIHQLLINLCTNAHHAIGEKNGIIAISTEDKRIRNTWKTNDTLIPPGSYLELKVSDTGAGMNQTTMEKIFDPYFTTKQVGSGTGIGLAIVKAIAKEHSGYISVSSIPDKGTNFYTYLPLFEKTTNQQVSSKPLSPNNLSGDERIMVVDDEEAIRDVYEKFLKSHGYNVSVFENGSAAFTEFEKDPYKFDLVITDMTMPKLSGDKLAIEMLKKNPDTRILLCTGFSETLSKEYASLIGIKKILNKPLTMNKLLKNIREILDEK